ncbi:hypothetical protein [Vibrio sp. OPT18]|uniref:hypothetical protein n=1 Tax=Vibrio sp. OPT18 TaxID=2778641 RepID=UPI0018810CC4|nr:hypothetical protein [Vibrio sp. OPT18]MBE8578644.1 hypothetical protein [Vibrio sp. OPT18]
MPRVRTLEIVAEGVQRNGKPVGEEVLRSVVRNFNKDARPPVTLGHPEKGDDKVAALGRIANLRVENNAKGKPALFGEQIYTPELEGLEDAGKFEGQSAGIYPHPGKPGEFYLHHVAQLGQLPPAADIETHNLIQLSDDGTSDEPLLLAASIIPENKQASENDIMKFEDLMKAIKSFSEEEKTQLGEALGFKAEEEADPTKKEPETKPPTKPDGDGKGGDDFENPQVKLMQETMAGDRRDQLTELADSSNLSEGMKTVITSMIKNASAIELCNSGEGSRFNEIKTLIKAQPAKPSFNPFEEINLSDDKGGEKETFRSDEW